MQSIAKSELIICGTGHRPDKLGGYGAHIEDALFELALTHLQRLDPDVVITGMALGWDTALAEASYCLGIPFWAYIPFRGQESRWSKDAQHFYEKLLSQATKVVECEEPGYAAWKMHLRDRRMVDDSVKVLSLWNGDAKTGTGKTVEYALSRAKEVINLWEFYHG